MRSTLLGGIAKSTRRVRPWCTPTLDMFSRRTQVLRPVCRLPLGAEGDRPRRRCRRFSSSSNAGVCPDAARRSRAKEERASLKSDAPLACCGCRPSSDRAAGRRITRPVLAGVQRHRPGGILVRRRRRTARDLARAGGRRHRRACRRRPLLPGGAPAGDGACAGRLLLPPNTTDPPRSSRRWDTPLPVALGECSRGC